MRFNIWDSVGPWLPLAPSFFILAMMVLLKLQGYALILPLVLFFAALVKGGQIIHNALNLLKWKGIEAIFIDKDEKGNKLFYSETLLLTGMSAVKAGTNSATFQLHGLTPLPTWRDVSKKKFTATGVGFDMRDFAKFMMNGTGNLLGYPFPSGNIAPFLFTEIEEDIDNDGEENIAKFKMTSLEQLSEKVEEIKV